jgi:adenylate kinase
MTGTTPSTRSYPNILVTGTPGTGKTTVAVAIAEGQDIAFMAFHHVDSKSIIEEHQCTDGHDNKLQTDFLDEDKFLDALETIFDDEYIEGGIILDFHIPEIFPERWFDLILVCRTSTNVLFDRLSARNYSQDKRDNNMQAEIMHVVHEAAADAYDPYLVQTVDNNTRDDLASTVQRVHAWVAQWQRDHHSSSIVDDIDGAIVDDGMDP